MEAQTHAVSNAARSTYGRTIWHHVHDGVRGGLPVVLLLAAFTVLAHQCHALDRIKAFAMSSVVRARPDFGDDRAVLKGADGIHVLEISARTRVRELEGPAQPSSIDRVGGVAPIDRAKMVALLRPLVDRIKKLNLKPTVVAIDVDLAPLEGTEAHDDATVHILQLLRALTESHVRVVSIVWPRATDDDIRQRNDFMKQACDAGVYFASARLFLRHGEFPLDFPYQRKPGVQDVQSWPPQFPSLGTLIHLLTRKAIEPDNRYRYEDTLSALCRQARASGSAGVTRLIEEQMMALDDEAPSKKVDDRYFSSLLSWRQLDTDRVRTHTVDSFELPDTRSGEARIDDLTLGERDVVIVSIDGGDAHDKFPVASGDEPLSSAVLHALQTLSLRQALVDPVNSATVVWLSVLLDIGLGAVLLAAHGLCMGLVQPAMKLPQLARWTRMALPLLLFVVAAWMSTTAAGWLLNRDVWLDPSYMLLGVLIHTYVDAWHDHAAVPPRWREVLSFGGSAVSREWRAPKRHIARLADGAFTTAMRWGLLLAALVLLTYQSYHALHMP